MEYTNERVQKFNTAIQSVKTQLRRDLVGQDEVVDNVIIAIIAGGNVLLEGVPGVGKTRLVRSLGKVLSLPIAPDVSRQIGIAMGEKKKPTEAMRRFIALAKRFAEGFRMEG